jgi:hypothetical protein
MYRILSRLLLSAAIPLGAAATGAHADDVEAWRLFVGDQQAAKLTAMDGLTGDQLAEFPLKGYVTHLVPSESGQTVFAVQMDGDAVDVIKTGVSLSDHGEHRDMELEEPALLPVRMEGKRPVHAVPHGGEILQFFDLEGEARVVREKDLLDGKKNHGTVKTTAPHHGVVVPLGSYMLMSEPDMSADTKPGDLPPRLGLKVTDDKGQQIGDVSTCTGLHGEASSLGVVAFGCAEGVIVASGGGANPPEVKMLEYGADMPDGKVGTLLGGKAMQFFLGNYGEDKVVIIDPSADEAFRLIQLQGRRVDFALDPKRVTTAYILTEDGKLHTLDILTGELVQSQQVTQPYSKDGHWRDPRPRLAVMGDEIAVTDPREQLVRIVDAGSLKEERSFPVKGLPFNIVAIGGSGVRH